MMSHQEWISCQKKPAREGIRKETKMAGDLKYFQKRLSEE